MANIERRPDFGGIVGELKLIRREGITRLRHLEIPELALAVRSTNPDRAVAGAVESPEVEHLIHRAVETIGGERLEDVAGLLFGLEPGTRGNSPGQLRIDAAERWSVSLSRFRQGPEIVIVEQMAEAVLRLVHDNDLRAARLRMERREPTSSRLAVAWVERFEAMYEIWTPVYALGADLTAYRSTLIESAHAEAGVPEWEREHGDRLVQAEGYLTAALFHFTEVLVAVRRYRRRHGGMWLLSDSQAEEEVADAVYRISWHSPNNTRDDSFLRHLLSEAADGEMHPFLEALSHDQTGAAVHQEWQDWATAQCDCRWEQVEGSREYFPTSRNHPGIGAGCQLHAIVSACSDYCNLIDDDWQRIADWYHIDVQPRPGVSAEQLYEQAFPPAD